MLPYRTVGKLRVEDFRVRLEDRPGWVWGTTRLPLAGEEIYCAAGQGTVTALHGKTGDGSRLVQVGIIGRDKHPFFAAASNVLLPPADTVGSAVPGAARVGLPSCVEPDPWLGGSGGGPHLE
jgi:hypothetical protein